ncbi:MAG: endonuclease MutS2 [Candidatus Enteromonas sp.]|nr:endonuclease MutS2 [Candidatus Enteromonas sp.]
MQDIFDVLEWGRLLEKIAAHSRSERGKRLVETLAPLSKEDLEKELGFLSEMTKTFDLLGRLPIDSSADLSSSLDFARKGGVLTIEELERICHDVSLIASVQQYFTKASEAPKLRQRLSFLEDCSFVEKDIHKVIAPDLSIFDNASPLLRKIRYSIASLERQMMQYLDVAIGENKEYLSSTTLTMKNGHYVLPVANAYKHKVSGIVQDISGSGGTTFIEPEKLVRLNNQMMDLRNQEREEIARLLKELSAEVGGCSEALKQINGMIGYLDFLQTKVCFGEEFHCHLAGLSDDGSLFIPEGRHPLLDQKKVVPNDFRILPKQKVVIISGPNAGGKTVALKTIGMLVLMFESALPLPAKEGAVIPYYSSIYLDIGDSQSLSDNLSTFSGHMANIASICSRVGGKDLVLLDEVGTGTSPREGEALAKAICRFLLSKHCTALISSHFEGLKAFAFEHEDVENASMLFDDELLAPTYRLKMGLPGESYGLKVARRFGLPESVVSDAEEDLASQSDLHVSDAIARLGALTKETEDLKEELNRQIYLAQKKERELAAKEKALAQKEEKLFGEVNKEKKKILEEAEARIDAIIASLNSPGVKLHHAIAAKRALKELHEKQEEQTFLTEVQEGDYVSIPSLGVVGKVLKMEGKRLFIATPDGFRFDTTKDKVVKTVKPEEKKPRIMGRMVDQVGAGPSVGLELNIIGLHVDEALTEIDRYLDACRRKGFERVRIIHGYGSGALRKATHEYLKSHSSFVKKYELGGEYDGGSGATVVYLK